MGALDAYSVVPDRGTALRNRYIIQGLDDEDAKRDILSQRQAAERQQMEHAKAIEARAQTDQTRQTTADEAKRQESVARVDARQWAGTPGYDQPYEKLPDEARTHFDTHYVPEVAANAPAIYNQALRERTGKIPGLDDMDVVGATNDPATGRTSLSYKPKVNPEATGDLTDNQRTIAEAIANYSMPPAQALGRFSQSDREKIMAHASGLGYDAKEYPTRLASRKDFTSGKAAASITSLNTLIHHFDQVMESQKALTNTFAPIANAPLNYLKKNVAGNADITKFETNANAVAEEMAKLLKGGVATKGEIEEWKSKLDPSLNQDQLEGNIAEMMRLVAGRVDGLRNQWQSAYDKPRDLPFIDDASQSILKKHGFNPKMIDPGSTEGDPGPVATADVTAPAGKPAPRGAPATTPELPTITTQAQYDALPPGSRYRDSTGKPATKKK